VTEAIAGDGWGAGRAKGLHLEITISNTSHQNIKRPSKKEEVKRNNMMQSTLSHTANDSVSKDPIIGLEQLSENFPICGT
jgi:hypothetical protein